jgi:hypothetical protein
MSDRTSNHPAAGPSAVKREPQVLGADELIVYEAIATVRGPMAPGDLIAATGLEETTVRAALDRLTELDMIVSNDEGVSIGPNDWDVRGAQ